MILRLDPRYPLLWRTPQSLQLGLDPAVVTVSDITGVQERLLAALAVGVSSAGLTMIAGGAEAERDALLDAVAPAMLAPVEVTPFAVAISGRGRLVEILARSLADDGLQVFVAADADDLVETLADDLPDLAILVHEFVVPPTLHGLWLRRDVLHLPIVFSDSGVAIGPVVRPGSGPCLLCLELHRRDADGSWPAIATQLLGRSGSSQCPTLALEAAAVVARLVGRESGRAEREIEDGGAVHIDAASGARRLTAWQPHPECGCRGIAHLLRIERPAASAGQRESDSPAAVPVPVRH